VGDKHPPLHSRFKPGHSGNKKGRPKGRSDLNTKIEERLRKTVLVTRAGMQLKMPAGQAIGEQLIGLSMNRNLKAIELLMKFQREAARSRNAISGKSGLMIDWDAPPAEMNWTDAQEEAYQRLKQLNVNLRDAPPGV